MRRQDEIRLLFASQSTANRTFLLSELDRFAQAFDADELLDLLRESQAAGDEVLRRQALITTTLFLPSYAARRYGASEEAGVWTRYLDETERREKLALEGEKVADKMRRAAQQRLAPLIAELAAQLPRLAPAPAHDAALALALSPGAHGVLPAPEGRKISFKSLWAWAASGGARAEPDRVAALLDRQGPGAPDLFQAAMHLPPAALAGLVRAVAGRVDMQGTAHLALAVGRAGGPDAMAALEVLAAGATGWGAIYVLRALDMLHAPGGLELVRRVHDAAEHEFVRQQAVRAAGAFASNEAVAFCLAQLAAQDAGIIAQALESLVRLRCPVSDLAGPVKPLVAHPDLRVRVNALLATVDAMEGRLPDEAAALIKSSDPLSRIGGAFCLGYWQSKLAAGVLAELAVRDGNALVRVQAIKALSRYDAKLGIPLLTRLVESAPVGEALAAARVMARLRGQVTRGLPDFFIRELVRHTDPERRALLLTALGGLSVSARDARTEGVFATALASDDPRIAAATLEAYTLMGGPAGVDISARIAQLAAAGGPVAGAAAVVQFLAGELAVVEKLADELRSGDEARAAVAVRAALELAQLAGWGIGPASAGLARALVPAAPAPEPPRTEIPVPPETQVTDALSPPTEIQRRVIDELFVSADSMPSSGRIQRPNLDRDIRRRTYLVAALGREAALLAERPGAKIARVARQAGAFVRQNPILVVPPAVVFFIVVMVARTAATEPAAVVQKAPVAVTVLTVRGALRVANKPLSSADDVHVGEVVALEGPGEASFVTAGGDEVQIARDSEVELVASDRTAGLVLSPRRGVVTLALREGSVGEVKADGRRAGGRGVSLRCSVTAEGWTVEALSSGVETKDASGPEVLKQGAKKQLR